MDWVVFLPLSPEYRLAWRPSWDRVLVQMSRTEKIGLPSLNKHCAMFTGPVWQTLGRTLRKHWSWETWDCVQTRTRQGALRQGGTGGNSCRKAARLVVRFCWTGALFFCFSGAFSVAYFLPVWQFNNRTQLLPRRERPDTDIAIAIATGNLLQSSLLCNCCCCCISCKLATDKYVIFFFILPAARKNDWPIVIELFPIAR